MTDKIEIEDFFKKKVNISDPNDLYSNEEYIYVPDTNHGSYQNGQIRFNLNNIGQQFTVLSDSFLEIPLSISSSTSNAYSAATKLAIKSSLLSLISGVQINTLDGQNLVNEITGATPIIQNLKLFLDTNVDYLQSISQSIHFFGVDRLTQYTSNNTTANSLVYSSNPTITQGTFGQGSNLPSNDYTGNQSLYNRIQVFTNQCNATSNTSTTSFTFIAYIPLRLIHSIFENFCWPMVNYPLYLQFNLSGVNSSSYQPFTCAQVTNINVQLKAVSNGASPPVYTYSPTTENPVAASDSPLLSVNTSVSELGYTPGCCRIKLKTVKFHSETARKIEESLRKGTKKYIQYTVTDLLTPLPSQTTGAAGVPISINTDITNSSIRPTRLWVLVTPSGTQTSSTNTFPATIGPGYLQNCNIQVNRTNYYLNNLTSAMDFYKILESQMLGGGENTTSGSQVSFNDFICGTNPYCFDLSRMQLLDLNSPVTLTINTNLASTVANQQFSLLFLVERLMTLELDISSSSVTSMVSQGQKVI